MNRDVTANQMLKVSGPDKNIEIFSRKSNNLNNKSNMQM